MTTYRQQLIDRVGVPVTQAAVTTEFGRTSYLTAGVGAPVVCIHGAGAGAVTWYPSIADIAQNFRVIVPDVIGYGESDKPHAPYDRPYFSAWLRAFLDALGIDKACVVGLSQGGAIALQFALENPHRIEKLVLVDAGALGARPSFWPMISMIWMNVFPSRLATRFNSRYLLQDAANRDPNHGLYSVEVLNKPGGRNAFAQGRGAAVSAMATEDLAKIESTTLIIWGEQDRLFPIEQVRGAAAAIPNATFRTIKQAGHLPLMDKTDVFNELLVSFLMTSETADA
jgi:4,5:9,10-diseco-3-hydroxy-5,9,17-trioxoandrosta-1(10),2-diene-4-oate hydrolase